MLDVWEQMIVVVGDDRRLSWGHLGVLFEGIDECSSVFHRCFLVHPLPLGVFLLRSIGLFSLVGVVLLHGVGSFSVPVLVLLREIGLFSFPGE